MIDLAHADLETLRPLLERLEPDYPDELARMAECMFLVLRERVPGSPDELAMIVLEQAELIRAELGGRQFYLSKGIRYKVSQRDAEILAQFTGHNHAELARRHGVTERYVYDIVARRRHEQFMRRQGQLPLDCKTGD
jgi:Mor family transcriptional regulator